jgi:SAM-dependent methyltransferase
VDDETRHALRTVFNEAPADYDNTRPVCPSQLFDDLMRVAGLRSGDRVLEIGCGTGQATVPLSGLGLAVTAIELGPALASVARQRLASFGSTSVLTTSFEDWRPPASKYSAVVAVSSLHWIDPPLRYAKPHAVLATGGFMVVAGCQWAKPDDPEPFWTEVQADYHAVGYAGEPPPPADQIDAFHFPADAASLFTEIAAQRYPFRLTYSADDYVAILATQSGTHALGPARRTEFLARVRNRLESLGDPRLTANFVAVLTVGRRVDAAPGPPGVTSWR